jgi:XTP/dITP diphosphohydrolase
MKIAVASNNPHKIEEYQKIFKEHGIKQIRFVTPQMLNIESNPEETGKTLRANALIKAMSLYNLCGLPTIADDTGLFAEALDGQPGVHSARFAAEDATDEQNRKLLLEMIYGRADRNAYFETIIQFVSPKEKKSVMGRCDGMIATRERGNNGFGYDSVFIPNGFERTFAELEPKVKNKISHRYDAANKFARWLRTQYLVQHG